MRMRWIEVSVLLSSLVAYSDRLPLGLDGLLSWAEGIGSWPMPVVFSCLLYNGGSSFGWPDCATIYDARTANQDLMSMMVDSLSISLYSLLYRQVELRDSYHTNCNSFIIIQFLWSVSVLVDTTGQLCQRGWLSYDLALVLAPGCVEASALTRMYQE